MSATEMQAGRELDALIAERVFGWEWRRGWTPKGHTPLKALFKPGEHYDSTPLQGDEGTWSKALDEVPPYSTDIAAAWTVVEKLRERTPQGDIHIECLNGLWCVSTCFTAEEGGWDKDSWHQAETAPLAICRAALAYADASRAPRPTGGEE